MLELNNNSLHALRPSLLKEKPHVGKIIWNSPLSHMVTKNREHGRETHKDRKRERERARGRAQQSGPRASVQQWNHGDLSINRQVVVTGSIPAWSIASLLIAMCDVSAAHAPYFHVCQNLYGTSHMYSERLLLHRTGFHFPSAGVAHCRRNR